MVTSWKERSTLRFPFFDKFKSSKKASTPTLPMIGRLPFEAEDVTPAAIPRVQPRRGAEEAQVKAKRRVRLVSALSASLPWNWMLIR